MVIQKSPALGAGTLGVLLLGTIWDRVLGAKYDGVLGNKWDLPSTNRLTFAVLITSNIPIDLVNWQAPRITIIALAKLL